jgi:glyoxylase-like metal-dependent hydrolase (beta-lactamase superfamily II)
MIKVHKLTFNPFMQNTFLISDETKECVIIDPGCSNDKERNELLREIEAHGLTPVR